MASQEDVQEFHPYVFQIFAQLIELRTGELPGVYLQIFPPLLSPQFWERPGNVPPLVRLLQVPSSLSTAEFASWNCVLSALLSRELAMRPPPPQAAEAARHRLPLALALNKLVSCFRWKTSRQMVHTQMRN